MNALAFDILLQPEEIEEAYSLGRITNHEVLATFLKQYEHDFQYPSDHPLAYVTSVEFQTPYEQIVLRAARTNGYTKFKATEDYRANPGQVLIRVVTALRINYAGPLPDADSYGVVVSQSVPIEPRKITNVVTCDPYSQVPSYPVNTDCMVFTREIVLQFDSNQFTSGKATVKVTLPEDKSLETTYKLNSLK